MLPIFPANAFAGHTIFIAIESAIAGTQGPNSFLARIKRLTRLSGGNWDEKDNEDKKGCEADH